MSPWFCVPCQPWRDVEIKWGTDKKYAWKECNIILVIGVYSKHHSDRRWVKEYINTKNGEGIMKSLNFQLWPCPQRAGQMNKTVKRKLSPVLVKVWCIPLRSVGGQLNLVAGRQMGKLRASFFWGNPHCFAVKHERLTDAGRVIWSLVSSKTAWDRGSGWSKNKQVRIRGKAWA